VAIAPRPNTPPNKAASDGFFMRRMLTGWQRACLSEAFTQKRRIAAL
jgi:hypothetical protein